MTRAAASAKHMKVNQRRWDEVVAIHERAPFYDVEGFRRGRSSLHPIELEEVGSVRGKSLLHLQCHFGLDTLSWARRGARVTGVDYSKPAIALARSLARELGIPASFVESNIYAVRRVLKGQFDIVYVSYGAIHWLPDMRGWARIVASYLRPGGTLYLAEAHPSMGIFDDERASPPLRILRPYFPDPAPVRFVTPGDYADFSAKVQNMVTYEWGHPLSEVISVLAQAGLRIEFLHEFPYCAWRMFPFMKKRKDGWWHLPADMPSLPLMYSLKATAPSAPRPAKRRSNSLG